MVNRPMTPRTSTWNLLLGEVIGEADAFDWALTFGIVNTKSNAGSRHRMHLNLLSIVTFLFGYS
jgi:hypothetical protein